MRTKEIIIAFSIMTIVYIVGFLFIACKESHPLNRYELTIAVYYPTTTDTVKVTGDFDKTPKVSSDRGSNSIYVDGDYMGKTCIETSAPIKIIDSKIIQYNVEPIY
jgi:hypothetical protein